MSNYGRRNGKQRFIAAIGLVLIAAMLVTSIVSYFLA
jgi:hypothetical protein